MRVGELPPRHMAALEVVPIPGATEGALLEGHTLQPMGEGPLLAFPAGRAPEGLLRALEALFPVGDRAVGGPQEEPDGLPDFYFDLGVAPEAGAHEDDEYLLSCRDRTPDPPAAWPRIPPPPFCPRGRKRSRSVAVACLERGSLAP